MLYPNGTWHFLVLGYGHLLNVLNEALGVMEDHFFNARELHRALQCPMLEVILVGRRLCRLRE